MKNLPAILNEEIKLLSVLSDSKIAELLETTVTTGDTLSMLIGRVAKMLLANKAVRKINNRKYNFKKVLLIRIHRVAKSLDFDMVSEGKVTTSKDGSLLCHRVESIIGEEEQKEKNKVWFNDPEDFQDYVIPKGHECKFNNNSSQLLADKAKIDLKVKHIDPIYIDLYAVLLYENTRVNVTDANYFSRLQDIAVETKARIGYVYKNMRKLDSNSRNYPLNRNGFAYEYGDAFEKWLVEPAQEWLVDDYEIECAIQYLKSEFNTKMYQPLVVKAKIKVLDALEALEEYNAGNKVDFGITHKELGKLLHIIDINENIIENLGGMSTSCASYDFTNSGGINAANQFGDEKFMRVANLLGGEKFDTHQAVADTFNRTRDKAKGIMQGPNHGGKVLLPDELIGEFTQEEFEEGVDTIFGESYKYIHMMSQYGMKLADAGVTEVILERPDGVKAVWYPYSINCPVPMEDGSTVEAIMPYNSAIGTAKHRGLAVSILHSADAFTENYIQSNLQAMGIDVKTTLDNFYGRPSIKALVLELTFESLEILEGYAERQLQAIEKQTGILREDGWRLPARECALVPNANVM